MKIFKHIRWVGNETLFPIHLSNNHKIMKQITTFEVLSAKSYNTMLVFYKYSHTALDTPSSLYRSYRLTINL